MFLLSDVCNVHSPKISALENIFNMDIISMDTCAHHNQKTFGLNSTTVIKKRLCSSKTSKGMKWVNVHFTEDMVWNSNCSCSINETNRTLSTCQTSNQWVHCNSFWGRYWWLIVETAVDSSLNHPTIVVTQIIDSTHSLCNNFISGSVVAKWQKDDLQEAWICLNMLQVQRTLEIMFAGTFSSPLLF